MYCMTGSISPFFLAESVAVWSTTLASCRVSAVPNLGWSELLAPLLIWYTNTPRPSSSISSRICALTLSQVSSSSFYCQPIWKTGDSLVLPDCVSLLAFMIVLGVSRISFTQIWTCKLTPSRKDFFLVFSISSTKDSLCLALRLPTMTVSDVSSLLCTSKYTSEHWSAKSL